MYVFKGQLDIWGNEHTREIDTTAKKKWFIVAYSKRYDGGKMERIVKAVSRKQAEYFFHQIYDPKYQYRVVDAWETV